MEEEDTDCTPPAIKKESSETTFENLPQKSVEKYNRQYDIFIKWCDKHKIKKYNENVLLEYFSDLSKKYSVSSMWSYYSMIKATLSAKNDVDVGKCKKLTAFLKQKGRNHIPKQSKTLSQEEILNFLLNAPDETYLMIKICVIFGITGALRNEEFVNLKVTDIEHKETILVIHINKTKTDRPRIFVVTSEFEGKVKSIELYDKYLSLRPQNTPHNRLFVNYRNGKCTIQPVGIHTFGSVPSKIASYLRLPEASLYTGHCLRRTSATFFANAGGSKKNFKRHEGRKSDTVVESYVEESSAFQTDAEDVAMQTHEGVAQLVNDIEIEVYKNELPEPSEIKTEYDPSFDTEVSYDSVHSSINELSEIPQSNQKVEKEQSNIFADTTTVNGEVIDDCRHFANFIASKLRLYDEPVRCAIQNDIMDIFLKASRGYYKNI